jgi:hypothetical protein
VVEALIEREVGQGMARADRKSLPLYPEGRGCPAPTTEFILRAFDRVAIHQLVENGKVVKQFGAKLTEEQRELLGLAGVPEVVYTG